MALEQEIIDWAARRPAWQQQILHDLAFGNHIRKEQIEAIATSLVSAKESTITPLAIAELPASRSSGHTVRLRYVSPVEHVNALVDGQVLTFAPSGVTCVYGDNGSGKSGYARLVKQVVGARHRGDILTDIFNDRSTDMPSAVIGYSVDEADHEAEWPRDTPSSLREVTYYDEACGDAYLSKESAITYRPAALLLLDGLITVCDAVKDELDERINANTQRRVQLPELPDGTAIRAFVDGISASTTVAQLDEASSLPDNVDATTAALRDEEARLRSSDPAQERHQLTTTAERLGTIGDHLDAMYSLMGDEAATNLRGLQDRASQRRAAASIASSATFDAEPVVGIGTDTWRALWDAARQFSEAEAYPGRAFPVVGEGARCPLCQQALSSEASDRLHRFHVFMSEDVERHAVQAEGELERAVATFRSVEVQPIAVALALAAVEGHDAALVESYRSALARLDERKVAIYRRLSDFTVTVPDMPELEIVSVRQASQAIVERARAIDEAEFQRNLADVISGQRELEGRLQVVASRAQILAEISRRSERTRLEEAKRATITTGITSKASELTRDHVTALVRDRFTRESHDLRLQRITLQDTSGRKGQLLHRPAFLGAAQEAEISDVLSEGEQTALGLAGFLTEAYFDDTRSAIVLDDPVTSLDHVRRPHVAQRLSEFARDRQVIVFTHDVSFVGDLRKAAEAAEVDFTERCVERRRDGSVGICSEQHPWSARDARARLGELEADLARIKREQGSWDSAAYEKEAADWAGRLSETWERIVNVEIVNRVVDRGTGEVRPKMFRMLACITETDDREFQSSYLRCSQWARRHDKSPELSYVAPDTEAMEDELRTVRTWFDRMRKYGN